MVGSDRLAGLVAGTFTAFRRYFAFREARWTETKFRERLFDHIMSLHVGYHDRSQTGQLMSRASSDLNLVQMFVTMVPITIANVVLIVATAVILLVTDPVLALVAMAPLPFVNFTATRFSRRIHPIVREVQAEQAELATVVEESVTGVRVVKGFGAEEVQIAKLEKEADDIRDVSLRAAKIRAFYMPAMELLPQLGLIAVLGIGGHRVLNGEMTIGELVAFNAYVALLVIPLRMMGMTVAWGQRAGAALQRVDEVLSTVPEVDDPDRPVPAARPRDAAQDDAGALSSSSGHVRVRPGGAGAPRLLAAHPGRPVGGARRRHGIGQVDRRPAARAVLRAAGGRRPARRHRRPRAHACTTSAVPSASSSRTRCCSTTRWPRTSRSPAPTPTPHRSSARRASPVLTTSSTPCPTGTRTLLGERGLLAVGWPAAAHRHRPGDPRRSPRCSCSTTRRRPSTRRRSTRSARRCAR